MSPEDKKAFIRRYFEVLSGTDKPAATARCHSRTDIDQVVR